MSGDCITADALFCCNATRSGQTSATQLQQPQLQQLYCWCQLQVTHKHTGFYSGSVDTSDDLEALVPAWHPASSPTSSALRYRPSWQQGQQGANASFSQHCSFARNAGLSPQRQRQPRGSQDQHCASMDMLCRDMQQLDAQIADLDVNLASASHRLHH